jgi:hypothetical protein
MKWEIPSYEEIKMDAEIGSYQVDPDVPDDLITTQPRQRVVGTQHATAVTPDRGAP